MFGANGTYMTLLYAFPIGLGLPFVLQFIQKRLPRNHWFSEVYPVMFLAGGMHWSPVSRPLNQPRFQPTLFC
jgi:hypothetical protein